MTRLPWRRLWKTQRTAFVVFLAAFALMLFFAGRAVFFTIYWMDPSHADLPIEVWMTPGYVARSYDVPPDVLRPVFGLDPDSPPMHQNLAKLARDMNVTLEQLQQDITQAVQIYRQAAPK
ncbi:MAG: hypothetical protein ACJA1F_001742 [Paracoccaceae bacterium]